jgi:hypothetical protein
MMSQERLDLFAKLRIVGTLAIQKRRDLALLQPTGGEKDFLDLLTIAVGRQR